MPSRVQKRARGLDSPCGVLLAREKRKEHCDQLVADELVDHAVVVEHNRSSRPVETVHELANSVEDTFSATAVEPRMSAKSMVISISAPPWCSDMNEKHDPHQFGFLSDAFLPIRRMSGAPAPANGAAQSRHRGSCGMSLKMRRPARSFECPRVRKSRQKSSFSVTGGFSVTGPSLLQLLRMDDAAIASHS